jgi:hypothetical protein
MPTRSSRVRASWNIFLYTIEKAPVAHRNTWHEISLSLLKRYTESKAKNPAIEPAFLLWCAQHGHILTGGSPATNWSGVSEAKRNCPRAAAGE